eukprot:239995_1
MTNSISLDTMLALTNLYLVYFSVKKQFERKIRIKITSIIIFIHGLLTKSFANSTIGQHILILDPLEPKQIEILPLSMYIWSTRDRFCAIYNKYDFCIQNRCIYKYGYIIPLAVSNNDWIWSLHISLSINNDISTYFVCEKKTNEIYTPSFRNNWFIKSKINITSNDNRYSTMLDRSIMPIKLGVCHFYGTKSVNVPYPGTMLLMRYIMVFQSIFQSKRSMEIYLRIDNS